MAIGTSRLKLLFFPHFTTIRIYLYFFVTTNTNSKMDKKRHLQALRSPFNHRVRYLLDSLRKQYCPSNCWFLNSNAGFDCLPIINLIHEPTTEGSLHLSLHPFRRLRLARQGMPRGHRPRSQFSSHWHHGRVTLSWFRHFVPNLTLGPPVVKSMRKHLPNVHFDCHLCVTNPRAYVEQLGKIGVDCFTFHYEAEHGDLKEVLL